MIYTSIEEISVHGSVYECNFGADEVNAQEIEEQLLAQALLYTEGF